MALGSERKRETEEGRGDERELERAGEVRGIVQKQPGVEGEKQTGRRWRARRARASGTRLAYWREEDDT